MYRDKKILCLIPARGGSKGLPDKNIRVLLGKPLVGWAIEQAKNSSYIDQVIVSTDKDKIAEISKKYGAEVPFLRPKTLARDDSSTLDVILHALCWMEEKGEFYDVVVLLEPTSPLRETEDVDKALEILFSCSDAESIVGVTKTESSHPDFLYKLEGGFLRPYINNSSYQVKRRQCLDEVYFPDGSLYISFVESLKKRNSFYHKKTLAYIVPKWKSYEIDEISDFVIIEALLNARAKGLLK